ncbi:prepilin peptidase [Marinicella meishanensis]|uniref:prepilin peptidase n=1 Tax=Marinicella meishanensis TaxID=2873263 RepID=UPI001CBEDD7B|nr:A24 family peptidase [Marinicella sp. NBU2979]
MVSLLAESPALFVSLALVIGLLVGSFLNVVILRLPPVLEHLWKKEYAEFTEIEFDEAAPPSVAWSRSHCPQCKNQLSAWHNIPVISYLLLRGRCHFCAQKISVRYPLIELISGVGAAWLAHQMGFGWPVMAALLLLWWLLAITFIDLDTYLIPDQLSLTLLWLGLLFSLFSFSITPADAIIGALVGYLSLWTVFQLFLLFTGKEGMGYGDFKLLAAGGAWLGAEMLIAVLLIASVSGLVVALIQMALKKGGQKIPFGPYLSVGIMVSYLYGTEVMQLLFPGF